MKIKLTLDRFEGDFGVCLDEEEKKIDVPRSLISHLCEGDIFTVCCENGSFSDVIPLKDETKKRRELMKDRLNKIFERSKKEDKT